MIGAADESDTSEVYCPATFEPWQNFRWAGILMGTGALWSPTLRELS